MNIQTQRITDTISNLFILWFFSRFISRSSISRWKQIVLIFHLIQFSESMEIDLCAFLPHFECIRFDNSVVCLSYVMVLSSVTVTRQLWGNWILCKWTIQQTHSFIRCSTAHHPLLVSLYVFTFLLEFISNAYYFAAKISLFNTSELLMMQFNLLLCCLYAE